MNTPPKWAQELTLKTLLWWQAQGNDTDVPNLIWKHGNSDESSGWSNIVGDDRSVSVMAGSSRTGAKLILLHELTHFITRRRHDMTFWTTEWELIRYFKLPIRYCLARERDYKKLSVVAYHNSRRKVKNG